MTKSQRPRKGPPATADPTLDAVITAALANESLAGMCDVVAFADFLRLAWRVLALDVVSVVAATAESPDEQRFDTLLEVLRTGVPALRYDDAIRLGRAADHLWGRREHFDRKQLSMDAGRHAKLASSSADKARILAAVVRFMRVHSAIEIGTGYGLSALYLCLELAADGRIATVEISEPQSSIASELLSADERVQALKGWSGEVAGEVAAIVGTRAQLLFHDGGHSYDRIVADFATYCELLPAGAVIVVDDIRWDDPDFFDGPARTYEGWLAITHDPRVRSAVELNGCYGLLQLR